MRGHLARDIHAVGSNRAVPDLLRSIFLAELLRPSKRFWIVSAWVSDVPVVDNSARSFSTLCPEWSAGVIRLSTVLTTLMARGTQMVLIVRDEPHNAEILRIMESKAVEMQDRLVMVKSKELHEKGLLGDRFLLDGSMNLTYNGVYVNEERLWYRCDPAAIAQRRLELENRWRSYL